MLAVQCDTELEEVRGENDVIVDEQHDISGSLPKARVSRGRWAAVGLPQAAEIYARPRRVRSHNRLQCGMRTIINDDDLDWFNPSEIGPEQGFDSRTDFLAAIERGNNDAYIHGDLYVPSKDGCLKTWQTQTASKEILSPSK
jgi:hypothetical protein